MLMEHIGHMIYTNMVLHITSDVLIEHITRLRHMLIGHMIYTNLVLHITSDVLIEHITIEHMTQSNDVAPLCVYIYIYMYNIYMYVCVYIYIYMYTYTYIYVRAL